jgi:hypothetical protein
MVLGVHDGLVHEAYLVAQVVVELEMVVARRWWL